MTLRSPISPLPVGKKRCYATLRLAVGRKGGGEKKETITSNNNVSPKSRMTERGGRAWKTGK